MHLADAFTERRTHNSDVDGSDELHSSRGWKSLTQIGVQAQWADTRAARAARSRGRSVAVP